MCLLSSPFQFPPFPNFIVADLNRPRGRQRNSNIEIGEGRELATTINESDRKFYNLFLHMGVPIFVHIVNETTDDETTRRGQAAT